MPDNPLVGNGIASDDRHIAYGLRNPFRFTFRPGTNELWVGDVGWDTWEEIDRIPSPTDSTVENFGWPCYEGVGQAAGLGQPQRQHVRAALRGRHRRRDDAVLDVPPRRRPPIRLAARTAVRRDLRAGVRRPAVPRASTTAALFFADYMKACLWAMMPGANGLPDPTNIRTIADRRLPGRHRDRARRPPLLRRHRARHGQPPRQLRPATSRRSRPFTATPPYGAVAARGPFDASATTDDGPLSGADLPVGSRRRRPVRRRDRA